MRTRVLLGLAMLFAACTANHEPTFETEMAAIEQASGGSIGVYALDTGTDRELAWRADEKFAMASTFKPLLVAAVLAEVEGGTFDLNDELDPAEFTVVPYSPVINSLGDDELITIAALCDAATTLGDNTATNMLLSLIGGPPGMTAFLRSIGDNVTRLDREETALNANSPDDNRDTTTPRVMAASLQKVLLGDVLSAEHATMVRNWMIASTTGMTRLRAGLPDEWRVGDKTGTGGNGAANNVAIAWPPDRAPVIITVYMSWSDRPVAELNALHARIAGLIASRL